MQPKSPTEVGTLKPVSQSRAIPVGLMPRASRYEFDVSDDGSNIRAQSVIRAAVEDIRNGVPQGIVSAEFHLAMADLIRNVRKIASSTEWRYRAVSFKTCFCCERP